LNLDYTKDVRECLERKVKTEKFRRLMKEVTTFRNEIGRKT
jgi:hypothetical protein